MTKNAFAAFMATIIPDWDDSTSFTIKTVKAFYMAAGVCNIVALFHGTPHAEMVTNVLDAMEWFWGFIHNKEIRDDDAREYQRARSQLLDGLSKTDIIFVGCLHYLTNHLWEDYLEYGAMYFLLGEAPEASHARDNRMKWPTLKGRISEYDAKNTWNCMMTNLCAIHSMILHGVFDRMTETSKKILQLKGRTSFDFTELVPFVANARSNSTNPDL